jgi:predicted nuclease of predicted toxin-antitoxin system
LRPLLLDEGLPATVAEALATLGLDTLAVGHPGAPPRGSSDATNCAWCRERSAVLVTNDRGKSDKTIFDHLAQFHVHAIFVHNDLRFADDHVLARALLTAESKIDHIAAKQLLRHRLRIGGGIEKR